MKQKNREKRLQQRRTDFAQGAQSKESKVRTRWDSGGFKRPGSNNK